MSDEKLDEIKEQNEIIGRLIAGQGKRADELAEKINALETKIDEYHASILLALETLCNKLSARSPVHDDKRGG